MRFLDNEFTSGPYPIPIGLVFTPPEWENEKKRRDIEEDECWNGERSCVRRFGNEGGFRRVYICLADLSEESLSDAVGIVAHEATHAWQTVRDAIGESRPALEQEAYMVQWISQWVFRHLYIWLGPKVVKRMLARPTNGSCGR